MTDTKLTLDELSDLADLCDRETDAFDYDEDVYERFSALRDKLIEMINEQRGDEV